MHDVKIALHPEVSVTIKVNVARSPEEAELQAQGVDVMAAMFERDAAPPAADSLRSPKPRPTRLLTSAKRPRPQTRTPVQPAPDAEAAESSKTPQPKKQAKPRPDLNRARCKSGAPWFCAIGSSHGCCRASH